MLRKKGTLNMIKNIIGFPVTFYDDKKPTIIYLKRISEKEYEKLRIKKVCKLYQSES